MTLLQSRASSLLAIPHTSRRMTLLQTHASNLLPIPHTNLAARPPVIPHMTRPSTPALIPPLIPHTTPPSSPAQTLLSNP
jgi:hypothetical protein